MSTIIYLARPIDQAGDNGAWLTELEESLTLDLMTSGHTVFRPAQAWKTTDPDVRIESVNRAALKRSDCLVAVLPKGVPSLGVPAEIEAALHQGSPVVIVGHRDDPLPFAYRPGVSLAQYPSDVVGLVAKAIETAQPQPLKFDPSGPPAFGYPLKVTRVEEDIEPGYDGPLLPSRAYHDDAGLDLYASKKVNVYADKYADIPCGVAVELPYWAWGFVTGRSSALRKRGLQVQSGIIDPGYRGPLYTMVLNTSGHMRVIMPGERLGQLIIMHNHTRSVDPQWVDVLGESPRGINGFGSSGV